MQWEKNGMNLCPKNGVINCMHIHTHTHTKFQFSMLNFFLTEKFFMLQQWKLWGKIYEFIYMPLLLPLPVHMCVRTIFFPEWELKRMKNIFFLLFLCRDPFWGSLILYSSYWYCQYECGFSHSLEGGGHWAMLFLTEKCLALPQRVISLNFELTWEAISWHGEV